MAEIEAMSYHEDVTPQDGVMLQEFVENQTYVARKLNTVASCRGESVPEPPVFVTGTFYIPGTPVRDENPPCCCAELEEIQNNLTKLECRMTAAMQFHTDRTLEALQQSLRYQQQLVEIFNQKGKKVEACLKDIGQAITNNL
ncbi:hypothetical protein DPMN_173811 [Dreissena polymorpha]|uniref:Uncharacterized protein n=1 Tax=Dreissena polymorpha TaxID=45954 RepID=A0A9D4E3F4_DREPO|nr:hypothetical protein DPMN_173811 [Dreissena polymorpha]